MLYFCSCIALENQQSLGGRACRCSRLASTWLCSMGLFLLAAQVWLNTAVLRDPPPLQLSFLIFFGLSFHHNLWTLEKLLASPVLFLLAILFEMGGPVRWSELVHSDPDISGVNLTTVEKFLCEEVIVTKLCNCHCGGEHVSESLFHVW